MSETVTPIPAEVYNILRASLTIFKKSPAQLTTDELRQARIQAINEYKIETRVLNAPEAASVMVSDQELEQAYQEIRDRYASDEDFLADLASNQLDEASLLSALRRQCKVNTVLEVVASHSPHISEIEIGIYYHLHAQQFHVPERRDVSHILISINPDYLENTEDAAQQRSLELVEKLQKKPHKFNDLALKHSECPTALQGGQLGTVPRGKLYPELDAVLFDMKVGEISRPVLTEIGFHILLCNAIHKAETLSLAKATPKIRQMMKERARRTCQRAWLASLPIPEIGESSHD